MSRIVYVDQHNQQHSIDKVTIQKQVVVNGLTFMTLQVEGCKPYVACLKQVKVVA